MNISKKYPVELMLKIHISSPIWWKCQQTFCHPYVDLRCTAALIITFYCIYFWPTMVYFTKLKDSRCTTKFSNNLYQLSEFFQLSNLSRILNIMSDIICTCLSWASFSFLRFNKKIQTNKGEKVLKSEIRNT